MRPAGDPSFIDVWRAARALALPSTLLLLVAPTVQAQTNLGPSKCVGCHDHERQARKWQKEEPAAFKGKAHYSTLKQLDAPKSAQWAKAVGLADPYDVKGSCVKCHGTVFRGDANAGVSCESCHGPSSKYNDLHQQKGSYAQSVAAGLVDLKDKPAAIAKVCVDCHILSDRKLAAAGHPVGADFDAGASLQKLVHWDSTYNYAAVTAAAKSAGAGRAAPAAPAGAPPAATIASAKAPAAAGSAKAPPPPGGPPAVAPAKAAGPPAAPAAPRPVAAAVPAAPPAPWDWDQPVRPLPADYVPDEAPAAPEAEAASPAPSDPAPRRRRRAEPPPAPVVPPSLAEESPLPDVMPGAALVTPVGPSDGAPSAPAGPRPPAADAVALRGEAVLLLEKLLRAGARTPTAPEPARPAEYSGPDSELLRLQDEVLALALEALRRPE